jgi:hypothetical protein
MGRSMRGPVMAVCAVLAAGWIGGCKPVEMQTGTLYDRLQNEDPSVRIQAAVEAGNQKDKKAVPLLVDRLSDSDRDVRLFSGMALEKIVGHEVFETMGWRSFDPPEKRDQAVGRWRRWVEEHCEPAASQPATTQPT